MKWIGGILCIVLLLVVALILGPVASGESGQARQMALPEQGLAEEAFPEVADLQAAFYAETGHNVKGAFATFFWTHGADVALGRPLSEEFADGDTVRQVFEYVVVERSLQGGSVRLVPIGGLGPKGEGTFEAAMDQPTVAECFAGFYLNHGGEAWFGKPVGAALLDGTKTTQVFQFGSLEMDDGETGVRIGRLGEASLSHLRVPPEAMEPAVPWMGQPDLDTAARQASRDPESPVEDALAQATLEADPEELVGPGNGIADPSSFPLVRSQRGALAIEATVKYPQTGQRGSQVIYMTTRDSQGNRLGEVQVELNVRYPNRDVRSFATRTGKTGRAAVTFDIGYSRPGLPVLVDLVAIRGDMRATTQLGFTPWW